MSFQWHHFDKSMLLQHSVPHELMKQREHHIDKVSSKSYALDSYRTLENSFV